MRARRTEQRSIFDSAYPDHDTGRALAAVSDLLDEHPEFLDWIAADVDGGRPSSKGRAGLPCEVVLRCGVLKQSELDLGVSLPGFGRQVLCRAGKARRRGNGSAIRPRSNAERSLAVAKCIANIT